MPSTDAARKKRYQSLSRSPALPQLRGTILMSTSDAAKKGMSCTNQCFDKDITECLDNYQNKCINKYRDKLIDKH